MLSLPLVAALGGCAVDSPPSETVEPASVSPGAILGLPPPTTGLAYTCPSDADRIPAVYDLEASHWNGTSLWPQFRSGIVMPYWTVTPSNHTRIEAFGVDLGTHQILWHVFGNLADHARLEAMAGSLQYNCSGGIGTGQLSGGGQPKDPPPDTRGGGTTPCAANVILADAANRALCQF